MTVESRQEESLEQEDVPIIGWLLEIPEGRHLIQGMAWVIGLWIFVGVFTPLFFGRSEAGELGDTYGVLNSLFGGLTLLGAGYAVFAQHRQLELAHQQLKDADEERRVTMEMLSRQTEALLASAKLQAVNAIGQVDMAISQIRANAGASGYFGIEGDFDRLGRTRQYAEITLNDFETRDFDWGMYVPSEKRNALRKFYLTLVRRLGPAYSDRTPDLWFSGLSESLIVFQRELDLLGGQVGGEQLAITLKMAREAVSMSTKKMYDNSPGLTMENRINAALFLPIELEKLIFYSC